MYWELRALYLSYSKYRIYLFREPQRANPLIAVGGLCSTSHQASRHSSCPCHSHCFRPLVPYTLAGHN